MRLVTSCLEMLNFVKGMSRKGVLVLTHNRIHKSFCGVTQTKRRTKNLIFELGDFLIGCSDYIICARESGARCVTVVFNWLILVGAALTKVVRWAT